MAEIDTKATVADLVNERPSRARLFEQLGIDYCCGGARSLEEACAEQGLDARTLLATLVAGEGAHHEEDREIQLLAASPEALIQHIVERHHEYLRRELPRLAELGAQVKERHVAREPRLSGVVEVLTTLKVDLEEHLKTEEEELFPALTRAAGPEDIENPSPQRSRGELIESIEEDHEATGIILQEMKALTDNYTVPAWGCNSFRVLYEGLHDLEVDIHQHVHKENNILFPAVFGR